MDVYGNGYEVDGQLSIFDIGKTSFKIDKKVRLIELFGGVGSQSMALERLGVDFEHYRLVEFDKYPVASYNAIHGTNFEPSDITQIHASDLGIVDRDKYCYIMTYSFPCQDLSVAGKMKGMKKGEGTRSGLLWEVERLLNECEELPQVLVMENVPQVHSKANMEDFQSWLDFLDSKGYSSYWQDMNARDYGVAQNRNRTICVAILGMYSYQFPEKIELKKVMKDYLEDEVDDKYYITSEKAKNLVDKLIFEGKILTEQNRVLECNRLGNLNGHTGGSFAYQVYDSVGAAPTLTDMQGGGRQPHIVETKCLNSRGGRGGVEGLQPSVQDRVYETEGLSTAITTSFMPKIMEIKKCNLNTEE